MSPKPVGCGLSCSELIAALQWKVERGDHQREFTITDTNSRVGSESLQDRGAVMNQIDDVALGLSFVQAKLRNRRNAVASINLLPVEMMVRIFEMNQPHILAQDYRDLLSWALPMTSTCHRWRSIALSRPSFWQHIYVNDPFPTNDGLLALTFFQRSSPLPIILKYTSRLPREDRRWSARDHNINAFVSALNEAPERLEGLRVSPSGHSFPPELQTVLQTQLPSLKTLAINCGDFRPEDSLDNIIRNLHAPCLERLTLVNLPSLPPILTHLVHLQIRLDSYSGHQQYSLNDTLIALHAAPSLRYLSFTGTRECAIEASTLPRLKLPHLKTLMLKMGDSSAEERFCVIDHILTHPSANILYDYTAGDPIDPSSSIVPISLSDRITRVLFDSSSGWAEIASRCMVTGIDSFSRWENSLPQARFLAMNAVVIAPSLKRFLHIQNFHCWMSPTTISCFDKVHDVVDPLFPHLVTWVFWIKQQEVVDHRHLSQLQSGSRALHGHIQEFLEGNVVRLDRHGHNSYTVSLLRNTQRRFNMQWLQSQRMQEIT